MFFWKSFVFSVIQRMLAILSLVPLFFLNPACTFGSSQFTYCWSLTWKILSITLLACKMSAIVFEHSLALPFFGIGMKTDVFHTRPFRYDLNQTHYNYTVEVTNRFKVLDLIECLKSYGQRFCWYIFCKGRIISFAIIYFLFWFVFVKWLFDLELIHAKYKYLWEREDKEK